MFRTAFRVELDRQSKLASFWKNRKWPEQQGAAADDEAGDDANANKSKSRKRLRERVVDAAAAKAVEALVWKVDGVAAAGEPPPWGVSQDPLLVAHITAHNSFVTAHASHGRPWP